MHLNYTATMRFLNRTILLLAAACCSCSFIRVPLSPVDYSSLQPPRFRADSPWYQAIPADPPIDPASEAIIARMAAEFSDRLVMVAEEGSVAYYESRSDDLRVSIPLLSRGSLRRGIGNVPFPSYALPDPADDGHLVVWDGEKLYEFWNLRLLRSRWVAGTAAIIAADSDGVHHKNFSVRASGISLLAGMVWPQELEAGLIEHALVFGYPHSMKGYHVEPATRTDGYSEEMYSLPMGARVQLDPELDLNDPDLGLNQVEITIARALQTYGMILADTGSPGSIIELEAMNPSAYSSNPYRQLAGYDEEYGSFNLSRIPVSRFRVLELGPLIEDGSGFNQTEVEFAEYYY